MRSTVCWRWDARSPSVSPEPEPGPGQLRPLPGPCNTAAHSRGYGKEAVRAVAEWASRCMGIKSFTYPVAVQNIASRLIAEGLGGEIIGERTNSKYNSVSTGYLLHNPCGRRDREHHRPHPVRLAAHRRRSLRTQRSRVDFDASGSPMSDRSSITARMEADILAGLREGGLTVQAGELVVERRGDRVTAALRGSRIAWFATAQASVVRLRTGDKVLTLVGAHCTSRVQAVLARSRPDQPCFRASLGPWRRRSPSSTPASPRRMWPGGCPRRGPRPRYTPGGPRAGPLRSRPAQTSVRLRHRRRHRTRRLRKCG